MKFLHRLLPWIVIALAAALAFYLPDIGPEAYRDFESYFANERVRQGCVGYEVVVIKDGKVALNRAFGFDGTHQPLEIDTPLYIGPSSEILTGFLLYQLSNQKKIELDTHLDFYLSEFADIQGRLAGQRQTGAQLTLRMLAAHRVAFPERDLEMFTPHASGLEAGLPDPRFFLETHFPTQQYTRSRLSYRILAAAMEQATGQSFPELLEQYLTIPLEMYVTTAKPSSIATIAPGAGSFFGIAFPYREQLPFAAAASDGIVSSGADIAKFLRFLVAPRPGEALPGMKPADITNLYQPLYKDGDTAFGWRIGEIEGARLIYQGGSVQGYSSRITIYPERNAAIAILCAQDGVIISNFVLPALTAGAERILFGKVSTRLFPTRRMLILAAFAFTIYILSLFAQTLAAYAWARDLLKYRESNLSQLYARFAYLRTILGILCRIAAVALAPTALSMLSGRAITFGDIFSFEPGFATIFMGCMLFGSLRNISRLVWHARLRRQ